MFVAFIKGGLWLLFAQYFHCFMCIFLSSASSLCMDFAIIGFGEFTTSDIVFILHTCYIYHCNNFAAFYNIVILLLDGTVECTQLSSKRYIEEPRLALLIDNLCLLYIYLARHARLCPPRDYPFCVRLYSLKLFYIFLYFKLIFYWCY